MIVVILIAVAMVGYINIRSIANRSAAMYTQNTDAIEQMGSINASLRKNTRGHLSLYRSAAGKKWDSQRRRKISVVGYNEANNRIYAPGREKLITYFDSYLGPKCSGLSSGY